MNEQLIEVGLIGAGGHASDVMAALESHSAREGALLRVHLFADGDFDSRRFVGRAANFEGGLECIPEFDLDTWFLAAGYPQSRISLAAQVEKLNLSWGVAMHQGAIADFGVEVEGGVVILGGATISPLAVISRHAVVSQNASVGHDAYIGEFSSVMPLACVSGNCTVGKGVLIGAGATVLEGLRIGDGAVVGAGAVVLDDVPAGGVVVGVPGRLK